MGKLGWSDLDANVGRMLRMPKDVLDGNYSRKWPQPGTSASIELMSEDCRELRFYLDLSESRRSSSITLGITQDRKSTMQTRASDRPIMRIDYADNPSVLRHTNPDGTKVQGTHVHLAITDAPTLPWAYPLGVQEIVSVDGDITVTSLFWAFQDACGITHSLRIEQLLGV